MLFRRAFFSNEDIQVLVESWDLDHKFHWAEDKLLHFEELAQIVQSIAGICEPACFGVNDLIELCSHEKAGNSQKLEVGLADGWGFVDEDAVDELDCDMESFGFEF